MFQQAESGFDKIFGYQRDLQETFVYCNTMKNGSVPEKLTMQQQEIKDEIRHHDNTSAQQPINKSASQPISESANQSFDFDSVEGRGVIFYLPIG